MTYATGFSTIKASIDESNARSKGGYAKTNYFKLEKGKSAIIRFISDDVISVPTFTAPPLEPGKGYGNTVVDCEFLAGDKRRDNIMKTNPVFMKTYDSGKNKGKKYFPNPKKIGLGVVVLREEVVDKVTGETYHVDKVESVTEERDGKEVTTERVIPYFVNQSEFTFWSNLTAIANRYGLTRFDLEVTREGDGTKTKYNFTPIPDGVTDEEKAKWKEAGGSAEYYKKLLGDSIPNLIDWIEYMGSEAVYEKYVYPHLPGWTPKESAEDADGAQPDEEEDRPSTPPAATDLAAQLRQKLANK